jgi:periplasmic protein CpxP/Spy
MTDINTQPNTPANPLPAKRSIFRRTWFIVGAVVLTGIVGFGLGKASSFRHFGSWGHMMSEHGMGSSRMMGEHGMGGSQMQTRAEYRINRLLTSVDATAEQKAKVTTIVQKAMGDMQSMRQVRRDTMDKLSVALRSPIVDSSAIETLRKTQLQMAETMSKKMQETLLEAAEVLSPAQRAQLVDRWQSRRWRG